MTKYTHPDNICYMLKCLLLIFYADNKSLTILELKVVLVVKRKMKLSLFMFA